MSFPFFRPVSHFSEAREWGGIKFSISYCSWILPLRRQPQQCAALLDLSLLAHLVFALGRCLETCMMHDKSHT
jgi:hypothetical protein